jgi:hypothetical protein
MTRFFEPDDKIPILKLLERRPGEHSTFAMGPEPILGYTHHC